MSTSPIQHTNRQYEEELRGLKTNLLKMGGLVERQIADAVSALFQPAASDLRLITTALKITTDLERIGDMAVNMCERVLELNLEPTLKPYIDIPRMADCAQSMVKDSLDAFIRGDCDLARDVIA